ncbi:hypothetical protein BJ875DRAFT_442686 [Amylocarpus encephaloides]|uniref:Uncharacterized protein n=1 Tax=Amylocarpus encephaloides TaxID=45428 RepID=A0A9P7YG72_9HELO|nr:hypothetical protein BJ875DRAFT_442686 [Amylocarpus encephaloides]
MATVTSSKIFDCSYRKTAGARNDLQPFAIKDTRLRGVFVPVVASVVSLVAFGWVLDRTLIFNTVFLRLDDKHHLSKHIRKAPAVAWASGNFQLTQGLVLEAQAY